MPFNQISEAAWQAHPLPEILINVNGGVSGSEASRDQAAFPIASNNTLE